MGVIQGTINTALGATAGAIVGATKMKEAKLEAIKKAKVELPKVNLNLAANQEALEQNQVAMQKAQSGRNALGQFRSKAAVAKDVSKIALVRDVLQSQREAMQMDKEGYMKILGGKR